MRVFLLEFVFLFSVAMFISPVVHADEPVSQPGISAGVKLPRLRLAVTPPLDAVQVKLDDALLLGEVPVTIRLAYDAGGVVTRAEIQVSSGDDDVDEALSAWALQARVKADIAGEGLLNMRLDTGNVPFTIPSVVKAASTWAIEEALRESHLLRLQTSALVTVDARGKATEVLVVPTTRDKPLDAAIHKWAMRNRYSTGTPGVVQLPMRLNVNLVGEARAMEVRVVAPRSLDIIDQPSVGGIGRALSNSFLDNIDFEADISYDVGGNVTDVHILGPTSSITVRQAIIEWIKGLRVRPGNAGTSRIRVIVEPE